MSKTKTYNETFYSLSEDEMQALLNRAKSLDVAAQNELLEIFSNFLMKYTTMLYHGKYSLNDYDIRRFIALFVKDPNVRRPLTRNKLNRANQAKVREVMRGIQYMVQRFGVIEDVDQTVKLTFFQCIEKYKRTPSKAGGYVPFSGYLYSYYFYMLKKNVDLLLIDQLGRKTFPLITDEESHSEDGEERPVGFTAPPADAAEDLIYTEEIDESWVTGETAQAPFDVLTIQERQLIKWRYVNGERSSEIANRVTEHPNTVREHFNRIRRKLNERIEQDLQDERSL